ncbi:DUF4350 domain-containing protein [Algibacter amylolyticus]|uniref:DUF4350 domain-containing protein n=1 Tax=Algibacter amylolyticus TaxID=1608400 RepID=A0A5M7B794_9FLAO|nr:DUF4350 domain-containing protein [Algibacter amylolyticus]KAA5823351.1 DUF4350 domain-containing protein [Algibacter amylolyticus]MBB5267495.1 hypothetical protein [Algibacter amylolyticus]TSJ73839.1 DUF4350 domain-containing protein [Algibacter amylolyticus]
MKKILPVILILVLLVITASIVIGVKRTKVVDWEESFDEKSNKPYGVSVLYKELPELFKDYKVRTVYHQPSSYLSANSEDGYGEHVAQGNYIIIGNSDYLEDDSIDELLSFVDAGNTLFLSDYYFPQKLHDTLEVSVKYIDNETDSISVLSLKHLNIPEITLDRNVSDQYFSDFDSINHSVLGYSKIDYKHPNFLQVPFGDGTIYLHLEPKIFTNYHLLKEDRYQYIEGALSYLQDNDVYFDSYTKIQTGYDGDVEQESNLGWFLEQLSFRWAWFTAIVFGILFMIFNAKRRQRIIKIVKPLQNTTVAFVKTVSNLYFDTKDHKNLIDKKITYFLEKIRHDLNLNTDVLDEQFAEKLAAKTGKKLDDIKKLVNYINLMRAKNEFFEENLIKLNRHIEAFYTK